MGYIAISQDDEREQLVRDLVCLDGVSKALAEIVASRAVRGQWKRYAGKGVYFKRGRSGRGINAQQLYKEYNGSNQSELAERYGVSIRRVEQIVAECLHLRRLGGRHE